MNRWTHLCELLADPAGESNRVALLLSQWPATVSWYVLTPRGHRASPGPRWSAQFEALTDATAPAEHG